VLYFWIIPAFFRSAAAFSDRVCAAHVIFAAILSQGAPMKKDVVKKFLIAAFAAATLSGAPALAADMATKAPPKAAIPAPVFTWTGFYVGGNVGYGWKDPTVTLTPNDAVAQVVTCGGGLGGTCPPPASFNIHGALGGLQIGYNWQANQNWLFGLETDFNWSNVKGTGSSNFFIGQPVAPAPSSFQASENVKWFGTARGRIGFLPTNNLLLYATGGLAYGRVSDNVGLNSTAAGVIGVATGFRCTVGGPGATNCFLGNASRTATGVTVGGGAEYALWNNVSVKAEYLYVNLGHGNSVNVVAQVANPGIAPSSFTAAYSTVDFHVVRGGVNYRF
jgi:outer membrane immunogenic protein